MCLLQTLHIQPRDDSIIASGMLVQSVIGCLLEQLPTTFALVDSGFERALQSIAQASTANNTFDEGDDTSEMADALTKALSIIVRSVESVNCSASTEPISEKMSCLTLLGGIYNSCLVSHARM